LARPLGSRAAAPQSADRPAAALAAAAAAAAADADGERRTVPRRRWSQTDLYSLAASATVAAEAAVAASTVAAAGETTVPEGRALTGRAPDGTAPDGSGKLQRTSPEGRPGSSDHKPTASRHNQLGSGQVSLQPAGSAGSADGSRPERKTPAAWQVRAARRPCRLG
jgi:hypothetical protein